MSIRRSLLTVLVLALLALPRIAANGEQTRLLRSPAVSATQIAFAYANNIWTVERAGGMARRLTSFQGETSNPKFSPTANRSPSPASTAGTWTCTSCRPKAASRSG